LRLRGLCLRGMLSSPGKCTCLFTFVNYIHAKELELLAGQLPVRLRGPAHIGVYWMCQRVC